jgi:hypothetical protein
MFKHTSVVYKSGFTGLLLQSTGVYWTDSGAFAQIHGSGEHRNARWLESCGRVSLDPDLSHVMDDPT